MSRTSGTNVPNMARVDALIAEVKALEVPEMSQFICRIESIIAGFDAAPLPEELSIESAFGLWKDRDITKESLRRLSWKS